MSRRSFLNRSAGLVVAGLAAPQLRAKGRRLRFGVGPFMPTAADTRRSFTPLFAHLAKEMGVPDYELAVSSDWAGLAVAMGSGQLDAAWMGPWGYVIARNSTACEAIATVKYDDKPTYHALIIARPDLVVRQFPDDTRGRSISFADVGSTSGWLIPTFYARQVWNIDPRTFWKYTEGASHPGNEIAVASGQVDLATDFDRNRNAMITAGRIRSGDTQVVWTSRALPNDAFTVPKTTAVAERQAMQSILTEITSDRARAIMPPRYTGFVPATHATYSLIEDAGIALGRIKARS
jgi:phosphonate transport system substrate-binding protein